MSTIAVFSIVCDLAARRLTLTRERSAPIPGNRHPKRQDFSRHAPCGAARMVVDSRLVSLVLYQLCPAPGGAGQLRAGSRATTRLGEKASEPRVL
jgi:hypothetical protein